MLPSVRSWLSVYVRLQDAQRKQQAVAMLPKALARDLVISADHQGSGLGIAHHEKTIQQALAVC